MGCTYDVCIFTVFGFCGLMHVKCKHVNHTVIYAYEYLKMQSVVLVVGCCVKWIIVQQQTAKTPNNETYAYNFELFNQFQNQQFNFLKLFYYLTFYGPFILRSDEHCKQKYTKVCRFFVVDSDQITQYY